MAVMAYKCPEHTITVVDVNAARIEAWNSDRLPIYEPGLHEIVMKVRGKNLFFSTKIAACIRDADIVFVSVNTPTKTYGEGKGRAADLRYWEQTARSIVDASTRDKIIVEKSTVPVRTAEAMERILNANDKGIHFDVLSNPEFLAEGTAIDNLLHPDRVLIGSREDASGIRARQRIVALYRNWVAHDNIVTSNVWSAELSKLASNAFLAQRISSINSISALCEKTGADIEEVSYAIGRDTRIGNKFLRASAGFGGSCFKKDILNLVYLCEWFHLPEVARYWESVVSMNEYQKRRFVRHVTASLFNTLVDKHICLFGFSFKPHTGDTRESPAIDIARMLVNEGAWVTITDPEALGHVPDDLSDVYDRIRVCEDPYTAVNGVHGICVLTGWPVYASLDYERIFQQMEKPAHLFDACNLLNVKEMEKAGFHVYSLGRSTRTII
jgi:UDPglucose 6-dehydrogenase